MIAYIDTSALVPMIIDEPSSAACRRIWDDAETIVTSRLTYVEVAAALAQATRLGRLDAWGHRAALGALQSLWSQVVAIDVDQELAEMAAADAQRWNLRGYDAVHCASARLVQDDDLLGASGDRALLAAWSAVGIGSYDTNASGPGSPG